MILMVIITLLFFSHLITKNNRIQWNVYYLVMQECMQMTGWQTMMRTAILCSRAEYFIDQHPTNRQVPLGEWFVRSTLTNR